jgi:hypothetical protein
VAGSSFVPALSTVRPAGRRGVQNVVDVTASTTRVVASHVSRAPAGLWGGDLARDGGQLLRDLSGQPLPGMRQAGGPSWRDLPIPTASPSSPLTTFHGVVTEQDIVDLYLANRTKAVRIARHLCGDLHAEDCVQDVVVYMLEKRDLLTAPPNKRYFFKAVTHGAMRRHRAAWAKYVVPLDPEDLVLAEQAVYPGRARSSDTRVRLPV